MRQNQLLRIGSQPPDWQAALQAHGDRLLSPGKERKVWTGTISRRGAAARPFQLTGELPNLMRFQEQGGATVVFDGAAYGRGAGGVQKEDADLVETLGYDCPEAFLYAIANQWPVRKLGTRFRMDGQVKTRYTGAVYDVFTIMAPVQQAGRVKRQAKYYLVNSDTNLLERVRYVDADNPGTKVEVFLEHWGAVSKNRVPGTIRRVENGTEVLRLNVAAAALGRAMADDAFVKP